MEICLGHGLAPARLTYPDGGETQFRRLRLYFGLEMEIRMPKDSPRNAFERERRELLEQIESWLEVPMLVLGFVWLVLLGIEFLWEEVWEQNPLFNSLSTVIWIIFILNFVVELILAPRKLEYFQRNWLTTLALVVPALRVFRVFRVFGFLRATRVARGFRLVRVVGSLNRGMRALGASMSRRGFGYVVALTVIVTYVWCRRNVRI